MLKQYHMIACFEVLLYTMCFTYYCFWSLFSLLRNWSFLKLGQFNLPQVLQWNSKHLTLHQGCLSKNTWILALVSSSSSGLYVLTFGSNSQTRTSENFSWMSVSDILTKPVGGWSQKPFTLHDCQHFLLIFFDAPYFCHLQLWPFLMMAEAVYSRTGIYLCSAALE